MWDRCEFKRLGKINLKKSYWAAVIVSLIFMAVNGDFNQSGGSSNSYNNNYEATTIYEKTEPILTPMFNYLESFSIGKAINQTLLVFFENSLIVSILLASIIFSIAFLLLVKLPLEVGKSRFFITNINGRPKISSMLYSYKEGGLKNTAFTMFLRLVFSLLWTLLLIIPGIIKSLEYFAIP